MTLKECSNRCGILIRLDGHQHATFSDGFVVAACGRFGNINAHEPADQTTGSRPHAGSRRDSGACHAECGGERPARQQRHQARNHYDAGGGQQSGEAADDPASDRSCRCIFGRWSGSGCRRLIRFTRLAHGETDMIVGDPKATKFPQDLLRRFNVGQEADDEVGRGS